MFTLLINSFNIHKFNFLPTDCIYVFCGFQNKQLLFPYTTLANLFLALWENWEKRLLALSSLSARLSVRISTWYNWALIGRIFPKFDI